MLYEKENIGQRILDAFTDEDKALNFPIKYPAIDLDKSTKTSFYITAGILAGGLIIMGLLIGNKKK
jgi:hypothetical protein